VRADLAGRHAFAVQRQDDLVDIAEAALALLHDDRSE
jgi:hypothetical protein